MDRYIVKHVTPGQIVIMTTCTAVIAETPEKAREQFKAAHPDREIITVWKAGASPLDGMVLTDEERTARDAEMDKFYENAARDTERVTSNLLTYSIEEMIAETLYEQRLEMATTPNAEGYNLGDILYTQWGYEQTNIDFYQIVQLKGKHTIVLRELRSKSDYTYGYNGKTRPVRDSFISDKLHTVRTKAEKYNGETYRTARLDNNLLHETAFGTLYDFSTGA